MQGCVEIGLESIRPLHHNIASYCEPAFKAAPLPTALHNNVIYLPWHWPTHAIFP